LGQEVARTWDLWEGKIEKRFVELDQQSRSAEQMAEGLSEAMLALARAVDSLGKQLSPAARGKLLHDMAEAVERTDSVLAKAESVTTSKRKRAA
jgi:acyl-CoA reductase-like NAD-dependent aldehyde dehydrogenase